MSASREDAAEALIRRFENACIASAIVHPLSCNRTSPRVEQALVRVNDLAANDYFDAKEALLAALAGSAHV